MNVGGGWGVWGGGGGGGGVWGGGGGGGYCMDDNLSRLQLTKSMPFKIYVSEQELLYNFSRARNHVLVSGIC